MIVLDTHTLIWWAGKNQQLSTRAKATIEKEQKNTGTIIVSAISAWEISLLIEKGRLTLSMDVNSWLHLVSQIEHLHFLPLENKILVESTRLPGVFHKDPADRMIVAQARALAAPLVTADEKILAYPHVKSLC